MALNDDTLLERVKLTNPEDEKLIDDGKGLSQLEQTVLFCSL